MAAQPRHGANLMPAPFYNPSPTPGVSDLVYAPTDMLTGCALYLAQKLPNYNPMSDQNLVSDIVGRVVTKQRELMRELSFSQLQQPKTFPRLSRKVKKLKRNASIGKTYKQFVTIVQPSKRPNRFESFKVVPYTVSNQQPQLKKRESLIQFQNLSNSFEASTQNQEKMVRQGSDKTWNYQKSQENSQERILEKQKRRLPQIAPVLRHSKRQLKLDIINLSNNELPQLESPSATGGKPSQRSIKAGSIAKRKNEGSQNNLHRSIEQDVYKVKFPKLIPTNRYHSLLPSTNSKTSLGQSQSVSQIAQPREKKKSKAVKQPRPLLRNIKPMREQKV